MMRRPIRALVAALLAVLAVPNAALAQGEVTLSQAGGARFPDRALRITLPTRTALTAGDVRLREDGQVVRGLSVSPVSAADSAVALVIDASRSMQGEPIRSAMAAAREFVRRRARDQKVAILTFNDGPAVLLEPTADPRRIEAALARAPTLRPGTHLYDATARAAQVLGATGAISRSVVVLSDGADSGSRVTPSSAQAAARRSRVRLYSVGLVSRSFDGRSLRALASGGGGRYVTASSGAALRAVYAKLGTELSNEHILRYRSTAALGSSVEVSARVDAGTAATRYTAPDLTASAGAPAGARSALERFWSSTWSLVTVALLLAALVFVLCAVLLYSTPATVQSRVAAFVRSPGGGDARAGRPLAALVVEGTERSLERTRWWNGFKEQLEIARIELPPARLVIATGAGTFLAGWLFATTNGAFAGLFGLTLVPLGVRLYVKIRLKRVHKAFAQQLPDNLQIIGSAMRAGHSFPSSLNVVIKDAVEPSHSEFQRAVTDEALGIPLDDALTTVARRMNSKDFEQVAMVAGLQRESGGNSAEVIDRVTETVRERAELRRMIDTLTAQGRLSGGIVTALPIGLLVFLTASNPGYIEPLFNTTGGKVALAAAAAMVVAGYLWIRKIVEIEV